MALKKGVFLISSLVLSMTAQSKNIVDIYGDDNKIGQQILSKYGQEIGKIEASLQKEGAKYYDGKVDEATIEKLLTEKMRLIEKIKKEGSYSYVDFQNVIYPMEKNNYTTLEVVTKKQPERLKYIIDNSLFKPTMDPNKKHDVIAKRIEFDQLEFKLIFAHKLDHQSFYCPVYHCVTGFSNPQLKPYLALFNKAAIEDKKLILNTLHRDQDPERRAAAAFLVGHFSDPQEIVSTLLPLVKDKNEGVRNNAIRVIGMTVSKAKNTQLDIQPFIELLDSPYTLDRNKSLIVLSEVASNPEFKEIIIKNTQDKLIKLLELKQPNNHEFAYKILKNISGKEYSEHDSSAWENWLNNERKQLT